MKPGIKTTEFWMALLIAVAGVTSAAYADEPIVQAFGIISAALSSLGYGFGRSKAKTPDYL